MALVTVMMQGFLGVDYCGADLAVSVTIVCSRTPGAVSE